MLTCDDLNAIHDEVFPEWVRAIGIRAESLSDGSATFRIATNPALARFDGVMSGQALSAIADTCMVLALAAHFGEFRPVATVDLTTSFMRAIRGGDTLCTVTVVRAGRSVAFLRAELGAEGEAPGAMASASFLLPKG